MIRPNALRFRISIWYFLSLLTVMTILAAGSWLAMRLSLENAVDETLADRFSDISSALRREAFHRDSLSEELSEFFDRSGHGRLYRILSPSGNVRFQSNPLTQALDDTLLTPPRENRHHQLSFRNANHADRPVVRLASKTIVLPWGTVVLEVAEPLFFYNHALQRFEAQIQLLIAILIVLATFIGFWLSGRALAPIDRIIGTARSIDASNLSARLELPPSNDELRRLSETLNGMLERIEQSVTRMNQFTADASHELRAPLTLIHTAAEYSLRRSRNREELENAMRQILRESGRTSQLVSHLLALARADSTGEPIAVARVDLTSLMNCLKEQALTLAAAKNITVIDEWVQYPAWIQGEESQLIRLFLILLDNAIKYTGEEGRITIKMLQVGGKHVIAVQDTGVGIAEDDLPQIFDRFWRADSARTRDGGGAGLGLSIAHMIVTKHGGSIAAVSELGVGSTFTVELPCISQ